MGLQQAGLYHRLCLLQLEFDERKESRSLKERCRTSGAPSHASYTCVLNSLSQTPCF